jgi:hypothetical protein
MMYESVSKQVVNYDLIILTSDLTSGLHLHLHLRLRKHIPLAIWDSGIIISTLCI